MTTNTKTTRVFESLYLDEFGLFSAADRLTIQETYAAAACHSVSQIEKMSRGIDVRNAIKRADKSKEKLQIWQEISEYSKDTQDKNSTISQLLWYLRIRANQDDLDAKALQKSWSVEAHRLLQDTHHIFRCKLLTRIITEQANECLETGLPAVS